MARGQCFIYTIFGDKFQRQLCKYLRKVGMGCRIEDTVLVTADGCEVLTAACPKSVKAVEKACKR